MTARTSEELVELLGSSSRGGAIDAPLNVWLEALRDIPDLAFAIADCTQAPMAVLACIAVGGDQRAKSRLVMRNTLPAEIVALLESDLDVGSSGHGVHAPDLDQKKLERFLNHRWSSVRGAARARLTATVELTRLLEIHLATTDWASLRGSVGTAELVPERFLGLVSAQGEEEAERWYWTLDNHVVVQGRAFWSAYALLPAIAAALTAPGPSPAARHWLAELLTEIVLADGHEDEERADLLAPQVAEMLRQNFGLRLVLASSPDERIRRCAMEITRRVETDTGLISALMSAMRDDPDAQVRRIASGSR